MYLVLQLEDIDVTKALLTNHAYLTSLDVHLLQINCTVSALRRVMNYFSLHLLNICCIPKLSNKGCTSWISFCYVMYQFRVNGSFL
jgi:hypothetical protein